MGKKSRATRAPTKGTFAVNLAMTWEQTERLDNALVEGVKAISLFWGEQQPYMRVAKDAGAIVMQTVGSPDEARRAEVELFVDWFNRLWKRPPNLIADELSKPEPDDALVADWSAQMAAALDRFESLLAGRDYLFGEFGVADCIAVPFLK